jgi:hypothetical protein
MVLERSHTLANGVRVRARLARPSDRAGVEALIERLGLVVDPLEVRRDLRRWGVVITAWDGSRERVVGFAVADGERQTLLADEAEVAELLRRGLDEHRPWSRRVA